MISRTIVVDPEGAIWDVTVPATWRNPEGVLLEAVFPYGFNAVNTVESFLVLTGACPTLKAWSKLLADPTTVVRRIVREDVASIVVEIREGIPVLTS